ncbi:MAG: PilZ domain-containing protein [bacterium]|nr:PilZ domain-containing protein [bacterium]
MDAEEIIKLTPESIGELVSASRPDEDASHENGHRQAPRWPFPGTTQLWCRDESDHEHLVFGTCCNVSTGGLGARTDDKVPVGVTVPIAIHLPAATYHGKVSVRHCTATKNGFYVGLEFVFD